MKNLIISGLCTVLFAFTAGCQKDTDTISDTFIGKWDWLKSISPWTGLESNPRTTGYTNTIEFSHNDPSLIHLISAASLPVHPLKPLSSRILPQKSLNYFIEILSMEE